MKKLLSVILSIIMLISIQASCLASETLDAKRIVKVGINAEFAPFEYYENGELTGFDIELMNCIGERIGHEIEYVDIPFDSLFPAILSGRIDCAISAITVTEERDSIIDFSREYLQTQNITFENGEKSVRFGEQYAIVFRDGLKNSPYKSITAPTDDEALYIMIDNALRDLSNDRTVTKLIEKYELNKPLDENELNIEYSAIIGGGDPAAKTDDENPKTSATSIPCSDWAIESIKKALELNIVNYGGNYNYPGAITREDFCELTYNLMRLFPAAENSSEVMGNTIIVDTENEAVYELVRSGIIRGKNEELVTPDDKTSSVMINRITFAPEDFLTREEAATIIIRMVNKIAPMPVTEMWFEYNDINEISPWATDSIQTISNLGVMNGVGNNMFAPKDTYTIEQAVATLIRVYEKAKLQDGNNQASVGIIGGADGPTAIYIGGTTESGYNDFCANARKNTVEIDDFYINEAIKLISESGKLAADKDFISLYTIDDEMTNRILTIGEIDFNKPTNIFCLTADKDQIIANIKALADEDAESVDLEKMSKIYKRYNFSTLAGLINSSYGSENLAALTILTNNRGYIMPKGFKGNFALYLEYEGEYSAIVSFSEFGEGVIIGNMSFAKNGDKDNMFRRLYEITSALGENSITIAKVR